MVQNAKITLTNDDTNVKTNTKSTQTGTYVFDDLLPGRYTIEAEASGFQKYIVHGVDVQVQQVMTVDVHLATGNVQQSVTVTAAAPLLEAENAQVGQTITNQAVNDLPLATRDWGSLAQMSAGVSTTPTGSGGGGVTPDAGSSESAYFRVNGVDEWQNDFRLNGINDNIEIYGGNYTLTNAAIVPPPDAIQEFTLQSGDFNAEFGHSTGGVINASIKSGTNGVHGDLWEYVRNDDLNANYFFNRTCSGGACVSNPIPDYHQNLFGFTAGGPVIIPGVVHGKNRLFWFADYQGGRYVLPESPRRPNRAYLRHGRQQLQQPPGQHHQRAGSGSPAATTSISTAAAPTDALGRVFSNGTILDPATTRQLPASGVDPVTGLTGTPNAYVRDPFYNCLRPADAPALPVSQNRLHTGRRRRRHSPPSTSSPRRAGSERGQAPGPVSGADSPHEPQPTISQATFPSRTRTPTPGTFASTPTSAPKICCSASMTAACSTPTCRGIFPGYAVGQTGGRVDSLPAYAWAVGYTRILTPTLTNDMHVGMVHSDKFQYPSTATSSEAQPVGNRESESGSCNIPLEFGIQGIPQVANNGGFPYMNIGGLRGTRRRQLHAHAFKPSGASRAWMRSPRSGAITPSRPASRWTI